MTSDVKKSVVKEIKEHSAELILTVPDSLWSLAVADVQESNEHIAVLYRLEKSPGMGMMAISQVSAKAGFKAADKPIKHYVIGKTWNWENTENCQFLNSEAEWQALGGSTIEFEIQEPSQADGVKTEKVEM